jgi:hypothetical protein
MRAKHGPFLVFTAGRSRTAWLSSFLSYGDYECHNEIAIRFRNVGEAANFLTSRRCGTAETAVAPAWQLISHYIPNLKRVVVRRPAEEILDSFSRSEVSDIARIDEDKLRRIVDYEIRCMERLSKEPGVLTVDFAELSSRDACQAVFEHCLPYRFDDDWWLFLKDKNIQSDVRHLFSYYSENKEQIEAFKRNAKKTMIGLVRSGAIRREH